MKTEIQEVQIEVKRPNKYENFEARIMNGKLTNFDSFARNYVPKREEIEAYLQFCQEVLEVLPKE